MSISVEIPTLLVEAVNPILDLMPVSLKVVTNFAGAPPSFHAEFFCSETGFASTANSSRVTLDVSVAVRGHDLMYNVHAVDGSERLSVIFYEAEKLPLTTLNLGEESDPRRVKAIAKFFEAFIQSFSKALYINQKEHEHVTSFLNNINTETAHA